MSTLHTAHSTSSSTLPNAVYSQIHMHDDDEPLREQDRYLPIANVGRIMKRALPEPAKVAKDAKESVQECVSEFIAFVTSEAGDRCSNEKRKTINGEDILWAMQILGFENYCETLKIYLHKYRELSKVDRMGSAGGPSSASLPPSSANDQVLASSAVHSLHPTHDLTSSVAHLQHLSYDDQQHLGLPPSSHVQF